MLKVLQVIDAHCAPQNDSIDFGTAPSVCHYQKDIIGERSRSRIHESNQSPAYLFITQPIHLNTGMKAFHVEQSLPICCSLAALGGILEVAATAVTAVPAVREKEGIPLKRWVQWLAIAGNVGLQAIGSLLSHLIATWFGPVSIVVPFFYSATLLSNMLIFGLLGERFTKNMRVGTHVIVVAVILLPVVGPDIQEGQDISILFRRWYSIAWFTLLLVACMLTGILLVLDISKYKMNVRVVVLLIARASSISVNLTVSRAFILGLNDTVMLTFIIIKLLSGSIYTYGIVVQSFTVEQATFVPLNATTIILVNALTGIIIWEDWRVVSSWYGYICIFVLLGLGCDLLLSVPLLNAENPVFAATQRASVMIPRSSKHIQPLYIQTSTLDDESLRTDKDTSRIDAWKQIVSPMHYHIGTPAVDKDESLQDTCTGSDNPESLTPQRIGNRLKETTYLLAQQPRQLGEKLVNAMGKGIKVDGPARPLSRVAAWRETVSPIRSRSSTTTKKNPRHQEDDDDSVPELPEE